MNLIMRSLENACSKMAAGMITVLHMTFVGI